MNIPADLQFGDILLYDKPGDLEDEVIDLHTGDDVAHAEVYHGKGLSIAARAGGVNFYDFRPDGLKYVRRPAGLLDQGAADMWFYHGIRGLPYGWAGLLTFVDVEVPSTGLICSVTVALLLKQAGNPLFADDYPIHKISPRDLKVTREAVTVYSA